MKLNSFLILPLFPLIICRAQIHMSYSIGCVGNTNQKAQVYSGPVSINGRACFQLANGVAVFHEKKAGVFTSACEVNGLVAGIIERRFNLVAYPNPVVSHFTIKSRELVQSEELVMVSLYAINGLPVKTTSCRRSVFNTGFAWNISDVANGVYIVRIASLRASTQLTLIKID